MTDSLQMFEDDNVAPLPHEPVASTENTDEEGWSMAGGGEFEPGPSFVTGDVPTMRRVDMPAWLQSFAAQESPDAIDDASGTDSLEPENLADQPVDVPGAEDIVLPDWLQDSGPPTFVAEELESVDESFDVLVEPATLDEVHANTYAAPATESFISEDDLPDWLRAFSEEATSEQTQANAGGGIGVLVPAIAGPIRVPPVENIWLSDLDRRALGPGGTLFAMLAGNVALAGDDGSSDGGDAHSTASRSSGSDKVTAGAQDDAEGAVRRGPSRVLLLTLLIIALLILISFLAFR